MSASPTDHQPRQPPAPPTVLSACLPVVVLLDTSLEKARGKIEQWGKKKKKNHISGWTQLLMREAALPFVLHLLNYHSLHPVLCHVSSPEYLTSL